MIQCPDSTTILRRNLRHLQRRSMNAIIFVVAARVDAAKATDPKSIELILKPKMHNAFDVCWEEVKREATVGKLYFFLAGFALAKSFFSSLSHNL